MPRSTARRILIPLLLLLAAEGLAAQSAARPPADGGYTESLGRPRRLHRYVGLGGGFLFGRERTELAADARLGLYAPLLNPLVGALDVRGEVYGGARGPTPDYGVRAQLFSPYLRMGVGVDFNGPDEDLYFMLTAAHPIRRGGVVGHGSQLRLNFIPGRHAAFTLGLEVPIGPREHAGMTRPRAAVVRLDDAVVPPVYDPGPMPALGQVMAELSESAHWVARATTPFLQYEALFDGAADKAAMRDMNALREHYEATSTPTPWGAVDDVRRYHTALERAFSIAGGAPDVVDGDCTDAGRVVADYAREILLDEVLGPYDRLIGQHRSPDSVLGFGRRARGVFLRRLRTDPRVAPDRIWSHVWVFTQLLDIVEDVRAEQRAEWNDGRFVWLPLQLALRPEEHVSQAQLDAIVERITQTRFVDGNRVWYVVNEQFPLQLSRTIHAAEDYHVLWVHDIRGRDAAGDPDEMSRYTVGSYLAALTARVHAYEQTGTFPVFMVFLDQWYYEANHTRFWIDLLQDPLRHDIDLPAGFEDWERELEAAQASLREAVAGSRLLQDQAQVFGQTWLRNLVKVHVSVTNPADPTFWRQELVPLWGMPDNVMRDHRKIAFYDIGEDDPYRGGAIYTGAGVGEHYATPSWEDRAILAEGPALLTLKTAARQLLIGQGIPAERVPWVLQARPLAPDYAAEIQAYRDTAASDVRALEVHNETGYRPKSLNVVKATLYSLMPPGSVAIVPDPLWTSNFWGSLLVGHALRGGRTLIMVPSPAHAPSTRMHSQPLVRETQMRILLAAEILAAQIEQQGGLLKVGVYQPEFEPLDLAAKLNAFRTTMARYPWFRELYSLDPSVAREIVTLSAEMQGLNDTREQTLTFEDEGTPKLHLKAVFLSSREAWQGLFARTEWPEVLAAFIRQRAWQIENRDHALAHLDAPLPDVIEVGQPMMDRWMLELTDAERARHAVYLLVGSHNHDDRSFALDGEAMFVVAGNWIHAGLIDLVSITGQCDWVSTREELEALLPATSGWRLRLARWVRLLL